MTKPDRPATERKTKSPSAEGADTDIFVRLDRHLESLPVSAIARLFAEVEKRAATDVEREDPSANESAGPEPGSSLGALDALPRGRLVALLRARLASTEAFPPRFADARRRFFEPFDAFFTAARTGRKRHARIPRTSLAPIWRFLVRSGACPNGAAAARSVERLVADPSDCGSLSSRAAMDRAMDEALACLFRAVVADLAAVAAEARQDAGVLRRHAATLAAGAGVEAGYPLFDDLMEIARLARVRDELMAARGRFPLGLKRLNDGALRDAASIFIDAAKRHPQDAAYILMFFAGRMGEPWSAMPLYYSLRREPAAAALANLLFDDFETLVRAIDRDGANAFEARDAAARFERCAAFATGLQAAATAAGDGAFASRVEANRDLAAGALSRAVEQARAALRAATPVRQAHGSTLLFAARPDIDAEACEAKLARAGAAAAFLARAPELAGALTRPDAGGAAEDAASYVDRYANDLVREIRAAEGDARDKARARFGDLLRVAGPLLPAPAADVLAERAAAAALAD